MLIDEEAENEGIGISSRLLGFLFLGITLVFVGVAVLAVASVVFGGSGSFGGAILIGPIPIVFGAGPDAVWLIAISIILSVIHNFVLSNEKRAILFSN
jgi:uncharacterized membrane protein